MHTATMRAPFIRSCKQWCFCARRQSWQIIRLHDNLQPRVAAERGNVIVKQIDGWYELWMIAIWYQDAFVFIIVIWRVIMQTPFCTDIPRLFFTAAKEMAGRNRFANKTSLAPRTKPQKCDYAKLKRDLTSCWNGRVNPKRHVFLSLPLRRVCR